MIACARACSRPVSSKPPPVSSKKYRGMGTAYDSRPGHAFARVSLFRPAERAGGGDDVVRVNAAADPEGAVHMGARAAATGPGGGWAHPRAIRRPRPAPAPLIGKVVGVISS